MGRVILVLLGLLVWGFPLWLLGWFVWQLVNEHPLSFALHGLGRGLWRWFALTVALFAVGLLAMPCLENCGKYEEPQLALMAVYAVLLCFVARSVLKLPKHQRPP